MARRVDNIDLHIVPIDGGVLRENGYPPLFLKRIRIHNPLLNRLVLTEDSCLTKHLVDQSGLPMINVRDDRDIANSHGSSDTGVQVDSEGS